MDACDMPGIVSRLCERTEHNIPWPPLHFVWEFLFAYLDDIYIVTTPERTGTVYSLIQNALWHHAEIRIHQGKTKVWNRAGEKPAVCDTLASGEGLRCPPTSKASRRWAHLLVTEISSSHIWTRQAMITRSCWTGFHSLTICSRHGCCWSTAPALEPIT